MLVAVAVKGARRHGRVVESAHRVGEVHDWVDEPAGQDGARDPRRALDHSGVYRVLCGKKMEDKDISSQRMV